jgi:hypothetical protein
LYWLLSELSGLQGGVKPLMVLNEIISSFDRVIMMMMMMIVVINMLKLREMITIQAVEDKNNGYEHVLFRTM